LRPGNFERRLRGALLVSLRGTRGNTSVDLQFRTFGPGSRHGEIQIRGALFAKLQFGSRRGRIFCDVFFAWTQFVQRFRADHETRSRRRRGLRKLHHVWKIRQNFGSNWRGRWIN